MSSNGSVYELFVKYSNAALEGAGSLDRKASIMNILIVSSEMTPFAKTGGLADVVGALPAALQAQGHTVWVVMPKYSKIDSAKFGIEPYHSPMGVWMGDAQEWCSVHRTTLNDVPVHFIEHSAYFDREGVYDDRDHNAYDDNPRRFGFLSRAALQLCIDRGFRPDVVHANDWQTAIIPAYLKTWDWKGTSIEGAASLLTIHNMAYQGVGPKDNYDYLGLSWEHFHSHAFEAHDAVNLLKGGIHFADCVNTVSPTYARETCSDQGHGLGPYLSDKGERYFGILNGVDYSVWNPETDPHIPYHYSQEYPAGKTLCKQALQKMFGLNQDNNVALLGTVGRLASQKGLDLLADVMQGLLNTMAVQVVLLGSGDKHLEHRLGILNAQYPGRLGTYFGFSEGMAHLIEAGSDFFLMPSLFEPCGLNQLYSLRYGTLPIVRSVGGLNDTVENYQEDSGLGTGFKFYDFTADALYGTIGWAVSTYYDRPHHIKKMRDAAMSRRFTWEMSAVEYQKAYQMARDIRNQELTPAVPSPAPKLVATGADGERGDRGSHPKSGR
jgi:starch synthase